MTVTTFLRAPGLRGPLRRRGGDRASLARFSSLDSLCGRAGGGRRRVRSDRRSFDRRLRARRDRGPERADARPGGSCAFFEAYRTVRGGAPGAEPALGADRGRRPVPVSFALGWTPFDPYALGYGSIVFLTALLLVTLAAWHMDFKLVMFVVIVGRSPTSVDGTNLAICGTI